MTALVPNISKEILCRPTWVIQILLFKLIFPFLSGCHMAICNTFLTVALACFEGIWFTCFGYILHIFGSLSTMFWVFNISFDMTFPFVTQAISLLGCESLVFIPLYSFFQNCAWNLGVQLIYECGLYVSFYISCGRTFSENLSLLA